MISSAGQFKQDILRIYNSINKKIFNSGVKQQRVDFVGNKIVILSVNSRVPVLKLLDPINRVTTRDVDQMLFEIFKTEIKKAFQEEFHIHIVAVLKDYDLETEYSGTIVILDRDVQSYLNEPLEL
ncbi:Na-translocating system protein MpsC family protein [Cohnella laeviribosi]|uniref:Na-translocating system protein MpsC family protein n=1 Tax=Cohnella laeviribosi TaxID=380174 RepID=UPI00035E4A2C|nr:Na-translocating system protein MpsC family protein [Cohnella laeviribosi]